MKFKIKLLQKITHFLLGLFVIGIISMQYNIVESNSIKGHLIGYLLPLILVFNLMLLLSMYKEKLYLKMTLNSLNSTILTIISFFVFLLFIKIELIDPLLVYVFIYLVFPYIILLLFLITLFTLRRFEEKLIRNFLIKSIQWLLFLIFGILLNKFAF
jgi:hypothetical protein